MDPNARAPLRPLDSSAEKGSTTVTKTLFTVPLCRFDRKPVRGELTTKCSGVEKPYVVDFASTPIKLIDTAEVRTCRSGRPINTCPYGYGWRTARKMTRGSVRRSNLKHGYIWGRGSRDGKDTWSAFDIVDHLISRSALTGCRGCGSCWRAVKRGHLIGSSVSRSLKTLKAHRWSSAWTSSLSCGGRIWRSWSR
jgi:hypothetical protein